MNVSGRSLLALAVTQCKRHAEALTGAGIDAENQRQQSVAAAQPVR
jgi:hypothetical protein